MFGRVYKIIDNTNNNVYIGSTKKPLRLRLQQHKANYKSYLKGGTNYIKSFDIIKNDDYKIEELEFIEYENKKELYLREKFYIKNNDCINKNITGRSKKEYYDDNIQKILKYHKEHYENHKDDKKEYYQLNKEKRAEYQNKYYENNKDKQKAYYEKNKEKIKEYQLKYRLLHKNNNQIINI